MTAYIVLGCGSEIIERSAVGCDSRDDSYTTKCKWLCYVSCVWSQPTAHQWRRQPFIQR